MQEGKVLIGGKDVKNLSYENLLKNLSFVFQDVFLFDDTVLNNIRIGRPDAGGRKSRRPLAEPDAMISFAGWKTAMNRDR